MCKSHIPGVSIAIIHDGKVVLARGYGMANVELSTPATENTVYQLASVTKTFTATAIMMLVQEGKLGLDDKINELLPDLPTAWSEVAIRHLLNHTSGIKSYTSVPASFSRRRGKDYTQCDFSTWSRKYRWNSRRVKSGTTTIQVNSARTGDRKGNRQKYGDYLEPHFQAARHDANPRERPPRGYPRPRQGYAWNGKELRNGEYVSPTQPFSAGMLVSNVNDLARWDAVLIRTHYQEDHSGTDVDTDQTEQERRYRLRLRLVDRQSEWTSTARTWRGHPGFLDPAFTLP